MKDSKESKLDRYGWQLVKDGKAAGQKYRHVNMDCPSSNPEVFGPNSQVYCLPAAMGER